MIPKPGKWRVWMQGVNATLQPEPGLIGTVGYLALEFELKEYDQSIDIWAMGIILYHLTYDHHPWKFAINPWCDDKENE